MKTRTEKELLELMLSYIDIGVIGLCHLNETLYNKRIITTDEHNVIRAYIQNNRPSLLSSWNAFCNGGKRSYWTLGKHKHRIKWLNQHINKLS